MVRIENIQLSKKSIEHIKCMQEDNNDKTSYDIVDFYKSLKIEIPE